MHEWDIHGRGYLDFEAFLSVIATYLKVEQLDQKVEEDYLTISGLTKTEAHEVELRVARRSSLSLSDPEMFGISEQKHPELDNGEVEEEITAKSLWKAIKNMALVCGEKSLQIQLVWQMWKKWCTMQIVWIRVVI
mgnify:CR=1 FL=1